MKDKYPNNIIISYIENSLNFNVRSLSLKINYV